MDSDGLPLPACDTPVVRKDFDDAFYQDLCYRLRRLHDQLLVRRERYGDEALEYRFGHTPPLVRAQRHRQGGNVADYTQWLEPATPSAASTPTSHMDDQDRSSPLSATSPLPSRHSTRTTVSPAGASSKASPVRPDNTTTPRDAATNKRKRDMESPTAFAKKQKRNDGHEQGVHVQMEEDGLSLYHGATAGTQKRNKANTKKHRTRAKGEESLERRAMAPLRRSRRLGSRDAG